uniref:Uncharacterized protein n=1 Tax=Trichogramma kaykai TaxID=54128 RepID=A0ABD2X946_9HYME
MGGAKFNVRLAVKEFIGTLTKFHFAHCASNDLHGARKKNCIKNLIISQLEGRKSHNSTLGQFELLHKCVRGVRNPIGQFCPLHAGQLRSRPKQ